MNRAARKARGAYYTPPDVAAALVRWVVRTGRERLLDPSCGDGRFLALHPQSIGVDCDEAAVAAAAQAASAPQSPNRCATTSTRPLATPCAAATSAASAHRGTLCRIFKQLYREYDQRYVFAAPKLVRQTARAVWHPDSPVLAEPLAESFTVHVG